MAEVSVLEVEVLDECLVRMTGRFAFDEEKAVGAEQSQSSAGSDLESAVSPAVRAEILSRGLFPISTPRIVLNNTPGGASFTCEFFISPQPRIEHYDSIPLEYESSAPDAKRVDELLESLRELQVKTRERQAGESISVGDEVTVYLDVELNGEESGNNDEPLTFVLGLGVLPPQAEAALQGAAVGEKVETIVPVEGAAARYKVIAASARERFLPDLDDDFAESLDLGCSTLEELKELICSTEAETLKVSERANLSGRALDYLAAHNNFRIPLTWIEEEMRNSSGDEVQLGDLMELPVNSSYNLDDRERAARRVRHRIIIQVIAEQENLSEDELGLSFAEVKRIGPCPSRRTIENVLEFLHGRIRPPC
ncbi:MAG: hypothetical protein J5J00_04205 [Deltaproteobacteria bacterium]|nr:hypothetical protein [Deltaproteobacteria bacterium]